MIEQTLFDPPPRILAYERSQDKAPSLRSEIVRLLHLNGEGTLDDFCRWLGKQPHQISGRLSDLRKCSAIYAHSVRVVNNRPLSVYRLKV